MAGPSATPLPSATATAATTIQAFADAIPHPIVVGCLAVGLGLMVAGFASELKSRSDRGRNSTVAARRAKGKRLRGWFVTTLCFAGLLTAGGTALTINGGRIDADEKAAATRQENERAKDELNRQFRTVLAALNAAKQEQTAAMVEARLKAVGNDIARWAEEFANRMPDNERQFDQAKTAERQREINLCSESAPLFNFTLSFIERAARAYAAQSGAHIDVHLPALPEDYFDAEENVQRYVKFGARSQWRFTLGVSAPVNEQNPPQLNISFIDPRGRSGSVWLYRSPDGKKFFVGGNGILPVSDAGTLFHEYEMTGFEQTIDSLLRHFLEAQLIGSKNDIPTPTPTAAP